MTTLADKVAEIAERHAAKECELKAMSAQLYPRFCEWPDWQIDRAELLRIVEKLMAVYRAAKNLVEDSPRDDFDIPYCSEVCQSEFMELAIALDAAKELEK